LKTIDFDKLSYNIKSELKKIPLEDVIKVLNKLIQEYQCNESQKEIEWFQTGNTQSFKKPFKSIKPNEGAQLASDIISKQRSHFKF